MTFREKLKKIHEAIKAGKGGAVFEYFYDYYKFEAFVVIAVLFFIGNLTYTKLTEKEIVLSGALLNQYNILAEEQVLDLGENFLTEQQIDLNENKAEFNTTLRYAHSGDSSFNDATIQGLVAQCAGGTIDFITGDMEAMTIFAYGDYFYDLREVLTEEEMELYEPYILYIDRDYQRQVEEALVTPEIIPTMVPPDMRYPEKMVDPVPVLIDLRESDLLSEIYIDLVDVLCFGFTVNAPHLELTKEFLDYLTEIE
ncbi:MAG: hypothetical protein IJ374_00555 [Lachnospiraceae bacterium]|nr:hypothetical protein [Lachnospiraceae bacterium]